MTQCAVIMYWEQKLRNYFNCV